MSHPVPIELEFTLTADDYRRTLLFINSGRRHSLSPFPPARIVSIVLYGIVLFLIGGQLWRAGLSDVRPALAAIACLAMLSMIFWLPALQAAQNARRTIGWLGPRQVIVEDGGIRIDANDLWSYRSWSAVPRVEMIRGNIFIFETAYSAQIIPSSTFSSLGEANDVYGAIRERVDAAAPLASQADSAAAASAWPPVPRAAAVEPVRPAGPSFAPQFTAELELTKRDLTGLSPFVFIQYLAAQAFFYCAAILVITSPFAWPFEWIIAPPVVVYSLLASAIMVMRRIRIVNRLYATAPADLFRPVVATDFEIVRLDTPSRSLSFRLAGARKATFSAGCVRIFTGPLTHVCIPERAFASPRQARDFAKRVAQAVKDGKRRQAAGKPNKV